MEKKTKVGCLTAAGVVAVVALLGLLAAFVGVRWAGTKAKEVIEKERLEQLEAQRAAEAELLAMQPLTVDQSDAESFAPLEPGESVTIERFLISMGDAGATELAKQDFREKADGAPVEWRLRLVNVLESGQGIMAEMQLPYKVVEESDGSHTSVLQVKGLFLDDSRDELLKLRRDQWMRVGGKLSLDESGVQILDARVIGIE